MNDGLTLTLLGAAVSLAVLHSLAPDHWLPFAALGRARGWSARRTAAVTLTCGLGHVIVSALLGLVALGAGVGVLEAFGARLGTVAGLLLLAFGAAYALWGLRRALWSRLPGLDENAEAAAASRFTVGSLFGIFALDPCLPLIPLVAAAAPLGWATTAGVVATYAGATLATMVALAVPARLGAESFRPAWFGRWSHAAAGTLILLAGIVVGALGI